MVSLKNKENQALHDVNKSDVFSLGMTMLECLYLKKVCFCYDFSKFRIE